MNIFEIQQSKQDKEFVMKNGSLEFEVFADILKTADDILYIGSLMYFCSKPSSDMCARHR